MKAEINVISYCTCTYKSFIRYTELRVPYRYYCQSMNQAHLLEFRLQSMYRVPSFGMYCISIAPSDARFSCGSGTCQQRLTNCHCQRGRPNWDLNPSILSRAGQLKEWVCVCGQPKNNQVERSWNQIFSKTYVQSIYDTFITNQQNPTSAGYRTSMFFTQIYTLT